MLPLVVHIASDGNSLQKCIEVLRAEGWTSDSVSAVCGENLENRRVVLHDAVTACGGDFKQMELAVKAGFFCAISGVGITDTDDSLRTNARACILVIPIRKLLVCSDSPWRTPQNLPDTYLRTLRNEPSNLPSIVMAMSETLDHDIDSLGALLKVNSLNVLGMGMDEGDIDLSADSTAVAIVKKEAATVKEEKFQSKIDVDKSKGKKMSKQALLQMYALNDKKKQETLNGGCDTDDGNNDESMMKLKSVKNRSKSDMKVNLKNEKIDIKNGNFTDNGINFENSDSDQDSHSSNIEILLSEISIKTDDKKNGKPYFSCMKCRTHLFYFDDLLTHKLDATKTVFFKVGEEQLCKSTIFLNLSRRESNDVENEGEESMVKNKIQSGRNNLAGYDNEEVLMINDDFQFNLRGGIVDCKECGVKLGKFSECESPCACGILVPGPNIKINSTKVDYVDNNIDSDALALRSRNEAREVNLQNERSEINNIEISNEKKIKKDEKKNKKTKIKSDNKGNFSSYRNKSFVPNASRSMMTGDDNIDIGTYD